MSREQPFRKKLLKILANKTKSEEFITIDFRNFANKSIRQIPITKDRKIFLLFIINSIKIKFCELILYNFTNLVN